MLLLFLPCSFISLSFFPSSCIMFSKYLKLFTLLNHFPPIVTPVVYFSFILVEVTISLLLILNFIQYSCTVCPHTSRKLFWSSHVSYLAVFCTCSVFFLHYVLLHGKWIRPPSPICTDPLSIQNWTMTVLSIHLHNCPSGTFYTSLVESLYPETVLSKGSPPLLH